MLSPPTLRAILSNAPMIIQGAGKLIQIIKDKNTEQSEQPVAPATLEGLHDGLKNLEQRIDATDESNIEQIKLIEELAKQNAAMAESLNKTYTRLNLNSMLSIIAISLGLIIFFLFLTAS